jgi:hypothetical protein
MTRHQTTPDLVPVLSRGRHRNPRKGACFMEMASYLAGERWSDHPSCTHRLLAALARMVNDAVDDGTRSRLIPLIPEVIGLTSDDVHVDARLALRCATSALPIASQARQNILAVGVLTSERVLAGLEGRPWDHLSDPSRDVLARVPLARQWAKDFTGRSRVSIRSFRRTAAPNILAVSVQGIAEAAVSDPDDRLVELLTSAIAEVREMVGVPATEHTTPLRLPQVSR